MLACHTQYPLAAMQGAACVRLLGESDMQLGASSLFISVLEQLLAHP